jgi:NAD(P)-dependent dehydrogenase (short-subunit alcohol dehydrogenase family)
VQVQEGSNRLSGRVAMITGGASGMGLATVRRFLAEGARVVMADLNATAGASVLDELTALGYGDDVRFTRTDVAVEDDVAAAVETAVEAFGRLDVVFNNAGVGGAFGPITEIAVDDWDYTFGVLVRGVFLGIKHGARAMIDGGRGGAIMNTASIAGLSGGSGPQAYSAAKAAVVNLTRAAAIELGPHRIRVNAICPGAILTPLLGTSQGPDLVERLDQLQPWPEHGVGDDIAGAALFLASDDARFVTGDALVVDGGLTAAGPSLVTRLGVDPGQVGLVGVNRGTTGQAPTVRRRGDG